MRWRRRMIIADNVYSRKLKRARNGYYRIKTGIKCHPKYDGLFPPKSRLIVYSKKAKKVFDAIGWDTSMFRLTNKQHRLWSGKKKALV